MGGGIVGAAIPGLGKDGGDGAARVTTLLLGLDVLDLVLTSKSYTESCNGGNGGGGSRGFGMY